jgi:HB1, ASXL, restriction endonuclease HTH domain
VSKTSTPQKATDKTPQRGPREGSTMWAAIEVLRGKRKPMTAAEIYSEIRERKLAPGLKGKTPEQTLAAQLAVNAKRGRYVERAEPGKFRLKRAT